MTTSHVASKTATEESVTDPSSMDFISQMVATGLSKSFESLKDKVSSTIKGNGEEYLSDALEKLKKSAVSLTEWSKQNPVKTAIAVAAVLAVTAFLVSTAKGSTAAARPASKSVTSPRKSPSVTDSRKSRTKSGQPA